MQRLIGFSLAAGLLSTAAPVLADCGLDVNPASLDSNGNAELSRNETRGSALAGVFDRVDTNNDGVISQTEYVHRCESLRATASDGAATGWEDTVAGQKARRQQDRQRNRVNQRVNQETDKATDSMVDKALNAIFGD